ncbi:DUF6895 family protein [Nonomuraea sp. NPDC003201]
MLKETGASHAGVEHLAGHLVSTRHWAALDESPRRRLGRLTTQRTLGLPVHDDIEEIIAKTWLGHAPEPWLLDHDNAYALTHTVFYLTDWGRSPARLPAALADYLSGWLPAWCQVWCEEEDWDLLGELLAVDACLPQPALDERLWHHLAQAQLPDGSIPGLRPHPPSITPDSTPLTATPVTTTPTRAPTRVRVTSRKVVSSGDKWPGKPRAIWPRTVPDRSADSSNEGQWVRRRGARTSVTLAMASAPGLT